MGASKDADAGGCLSATAREATLPTRPEGLESPNQIQIASESIKNLHIGELHTVSDLFRILNFPLQSYVQPATACGGRCHSRIHHKILGFIIDWGLCPLS
jgi:hypothetical protein